MIVANIAFRLILAGAAAASLMTQTAPARKKLLVIGEEKGYRHDAVTHAMVTIERLGRESGNWDTVIRTDTEALTKAKLEYNAKTLNDFDAVLFYTGGTLEMDEQKKADFMSFVHDDGKGFIGIHSAAITFTQWPAYGEMIGGYYDEHPWNTFDALIIVEARCVEARSEEPARAPHGQRLRGRVRKDVREGRVFCTTLGHVEANWDRPEMQAMIVGAIKWALRLVDADVMPRPLGTPSAR